jgi:hypothetical protein
VILAKLSKARIEFHESSLTKTGRNTYANYDYFCLGDFLMPILRLCDKHGFCGVVSFGAELATLTLTDLEDGSEKFITSPMGSANLKGCHEVQNIGAVETYQRRYLWQAAFEIVEHDALDLTMDPEKPKKPKDGNIHIPVKKGIGDDLPEDWKTYLKDMAAEVTQYVRAGNVAAANDRIRNDNLDEVQWIYMDKHLASDVRSALKKKEETK